MKASRINILSLVSLGLLVAAMLVAPSLLAEGFDAEGKESACLLIEPVICRSSEGTGPAVSRLDRKAIESVYAQANVQIVWLPPRYLDHTAARDGTVKWKKVADLGKERGLWESGPMRLSLVFVNKINGMPIPSGLGAIDSRPERPFGAGGPICIVALPEKQKNSSMESFCIAHEIGHCLELKHAIDDLEVSHDKPNIMGGGKFSERIGKNALLPSRIRTVRKSQLLWWPRQDGE